MCSDEDTCMKFVQSRFVRGGLSTTLSDYDRLGSRNKISETGGRDL